MTLATDKQLAFIDRLATERREPVSTDDLTRAQASALITRLLALPAARPVARVTEPGVYRNAAGDVFKVQAARGTGNLYAKRLTPIGGERLAENGAVVAWEFVYAPGALQTLTTGDRLTLEAARGFGVQYGVCIVCGRALSDAASVAAGIGPVCASRV